MAIVPAVLEAQSLRVSATPSLRIGAGEQQSDLLNAVAGATRLPSGQIVVGNRGEYNLLLFDASGKFVSQTARRGKGPGEIAMFTAMHRCGNAIYTLDASGSRVQEFRLDLSYVRVFRFQQESYRRQCNARGQFVHMGWDSNKDMKDGPGRSLTRYWIAPADSTAGVTLGMLPGSERHGATPRMLGREPRVAVGADAAYVALADSLSILVFDFSGKPRAPLRADFAPVSSTAADVEAEKERWLAMLGEGARRGIESMFAAQERPRLLPATRELLVDATGLVWVQSYPSASQRTVTWTVFRASGGVYARVSLPVALEVFEIGRDYVLGQVISEDTGVPEVHLYSLTR
jgi:hypothetical protein